MYYRRLRDLREDHDLKQKEVAQLLDIDQRVYATMRQESRPCPFATFYSLQTTTAPAPITSLGAQTIPSLMKNGENR